MRTARAQIPSVVGEYGSVGLVASLGLVIGLFCQPLLAAPGELPKIDFNRDVRPILSDHCYACHGPDENKRKAGLRLDNPESAYKELKSGHRAVVPGNLSKSSLVERILHTDLEEMMPPPESGKPLSKEKIELLQRWVREGATWNDHWSFIPPKRPSLPKVKDKTWPRNAVDFFILNRLEKEGFKPNAE